MLYEVITPCMSYNLQEGLGDNHYNCPVVAYYPEVIGGNMKETETVKYIKDYVGLHKRKEFPKKFHEILCKYFDNISFKDVNRAATKAYAEYNSFMQKIQIKGEEYLKIANDKNLPIIVLVGRPYHLDNEINHGIDKFISESSAVLISEDGLAERYEKMPTTVLNQWTYHSRLYSAANFVAESENPNINLVQLVSFGCGVDAITTDEVRKILEET